MVWRHNPPSSSAGDPAETTKGVSMLSVALALVLSVAANTEKPAVQNHGFEASPFLTGWKTNARTEHENGRAPTFIADRNDSKEGDQSLLIEALDPSDAAASQKIFLPVGSLWRVKAWIKTQRLTAAYQTRAGGCINE